MLSESRNIKATMVWLLGILLAVYVAICALLFFRQRSMIYYPTPEASNARAEDLRIKTEDATIQLWRLSADSTDALLYFGGNAEDVSGNIDDFGKHFSGHAIYLANYRGYGASTGTPSESAILRDAEILFDEVSGQHRNVIVVGRSLGSGVAVHLATARDVARLVLITPYDSIANVAADKFPIFPVSLLLRDRFDSVRLAALIDIPTLVVAAQEDEIIPVKHARALSNTIRRDLLKFVIIDGAGHNTIGEFAEYREALIDFVGNDDHQT
jgi:pimeloyl-ACP methyl ester carboxylesterase